MHMNFILSCIGEMSYEKIHNQLLKVTSQIIPYVASAFINKSLTTFDNKNL